MDTGRLNRWLTLGTNIGVLIGIILLVVELDQNRDMIRAQTRNELSQGVVDLLSMSAENKELADAIVRANQGEELTPTEFHMYTARSEAVFRYWENAHYQYRQGMYDEIEFSSHLETMKAVLLSSDGLVRFWLRARCSDRMLYSAPFMAEIDGLLSDKEC